jgi:2-methylcitrate dehydratase PrpD
VISEQTARKLAEFITDLRYENIPVDTIQKAKQFVLDVVRLCVTGSRLPWGEQTREVFRKIGGKEESTVIAFGDRLPAIHAAYVNGTTAHALENDDTHVGAIHHPGVTVIPAVLAVAERQNLGGKALLTGMIAGYEVMIRLGVALQPSLLADRGFHSTAVMGHFGAAAGSANLLDLSAEQTAHALAFAAAYASGLNNWTKGGMVKYIHAGKAARAGVEAALLAAAGLTGPRQIFEGKRGFCHAYADRYDLNVITSGLGKEWKTVEVHLKPHCTSRHTQASVEAAAIIAAEHNISPEDIASIGIRTSPEMTEALGTKTPVDVIEAQTSIPFATATGLFKGGSRTLKEFVLFEDIKQAIGNPAVQSLLQRIQMYGDSAFDAQKGNAQVTIRLKDGQTYTKQVDIIRGSPENPFTLQELRDRFITQAETLLPKERLIKVADLISQLEDVKRIEQLTCLLKKEEKAKRDSTG